MAKYQAGVVTISDGCARGEREDISGQVLADALASEGYGTERAVIPDDTDTIEATLRQMCDRCSLIITTGGTGFAPRDVTPEATRRVIERDAPGLAELLRWTGYQKLPRAVLSRGVAGIAGKTLIINLPGSVGGVRDGLEVLLPLLPHALALMHDEPVDHTPFQTGGQGDRGTGGEIISLPNRPLTQDRERKTPPLPAPLRERGSGGEGEIIVIETNIDDLSPELYEIVMDRLFESGALDVFLTPVQMKKNRPGVLLTVLCAPEKREELTAVIFAETSTFGVRYETRQRTILERHWESVETEYGQIRIKIGTWDGTVQTVAPEYADIKAAASAFGVPGKTVLAAALYAYHQDKEKP